MNILKLIGYTLFVQANGQLKQYTRIFFSFNERYEIICCSITNKIPSVNSKNIERFYIQLKNRLLNEIIKEIENNFNEYLLSIQHEYIILVYYQLQLERFFIYKEVIESFKNINCERKTNKKGNEVYFENICENKCYLNEKLDEFEQKKTNTENHLC
ncbi:uncharacterized protein VNE69_09087 [Vairimorpha necatrix]|uniref:Uncharacterized protein n=1 Tax=Vairimorpha necatrix TaxID=6039 RepID=A0AAX4JF97_9MICR